MPQGKEVFLGLNKTGVICFVVLIVIGCIPFCWIPFLIDSMKSDPNATE